MSLAGIGADAAANVATKLIAQLGLQPHPEGGWYRETWRGPAREGRSVGSAILFLLRAGERSHWHRVDADEIWHWHAGAPLQILMGERRAATQILGPDVLAGQQCQLIVPAGWWQSAETSGAWSLMSCTVSPGFRFEGYELAPVGWALPV
ncbi:cupin domain-containing protein [Xinfangfangia sp. D13-10-4-6]|uniref:cupin domain-containing protein n=1 Tax=Pseudogemmobacter hezensis TaxID=2737662 RepID=UPI001555125A|nr:cupin domain-containing protein [Pseudogemmobacter hezensis]NPD15599.1 cupin domain-containing protein [Pseudogemmobacter hezensis]